MLTTAPSTGPPSADHGFIRIAEASFTAASEKPSPAGSPGRGVQSVREPSGATTQCATPRPVVTPWAAASGGNTLRAFSGSKPATQVGDSTVLSCAALGAGKRIGMSTHRGSRVGRRATSAPP